MPGAMRRSLKRQILEVRNGEGGSPSSHQLRRDLTAPTLPRDRRVRGANTSSVRRTLARSPSAPSAPSSPSATATTLASTTITFCPKVTHRICKRHLATASCRDTIENLLQSWLIRISDQAAPKVFLQGLMCARSAFPQHAMGVLRDVFDLHTGHGATLQVRRWPRQLLANPPLHRIVET